MSEFKLKKVKIAGKLIEPLIEGGKGIALTNGLTSGRWAKCGGAGTVSGVFNTLKDSKGNMVDYKFKGRSRKDKQKELVEQAVKAGIQNIEQAYSEAEGNGAVFLNVLWEMGACKEILHGILAGTKGKLDAVSCGAGMPFALGEICASYGVYFNPIVSSARAFKLLWKRGLGKYGDFLGGVIYEDPWKAGGHNGLSNTDKPDEPVEPMGKLKELRATMNELGISKDVPIIMAGGVWALEEWTDFIDNGEIGSIAFQFGTRPLVTQESPISWEAKRKFFTLKQGDVHGQHHSPTGFYSTAINNDMLQQLDIQYCRLVDFKIEEDIDSGFVYPISTLNGLVGKLAHKTVDLAYDKFKEKWGDRVKKMVVFITERDRDRYNSFIDEGFDHIIRVPDNKLLFVSSERFKKIRKDMRDCVGCLSACMFSGWSQREGLVIPPSALSFCIRKSLLGAAYTTDTKNNLLFSGTIGSRFKTDDWYQGGKFIPTVEELFNRIKSGK